MTKVILIVCLLTSLPFSAFAHRRPAEDIKPEVLIRSLEKADFTLSAKIYFGYEDETEVPVEGEFYLLDQSPAAILKKANFNPVDEDDLPLSDETDFLEAVANTFAEPDEESILLAALIRDAVNKAQITKVKTNRFGLGKSATIKAGRYFLFGVEKIENEIFVWNLPVYLSGKANTIEINQYNADSIAESYAPESSDNK